jgi:hypothetical protein
MSSDKHTQAPFRPNSLQERLEWSAARLKERLSPHPPYANYTDAQWIGMAPMHSGAMLLPVLDPACKVTMPPSWYGRSSIEGK